MDVTVRRQYRERNKAVSNSYNYSSNTTTNNNTGGGGGGGTTGGYPAETVLTFSATATPSVEDYDLLYAAIYGPHPKLMLIIYDEDDNELELMQVPTRYKTDGELTRIVWDLSGDILYDGKIIINK